MTSNQSQRVSFLVTKDINKSFESILNYIVEVKPITVILPDRRKLDFYLNSSNLDLRGLEVVVRSKLSQRLRAGELGSLLLVDTAHGERRFASMFHRLSEVHALIEISGADIWQIIEAATPRDLTEFEKELKASLDPSIVLQKHVYSSLGIVGFEVSSEAVRGAIDSFLRIEA